jgi:NAD(P)-dependent dehydrogenase (short-subunit alcohol dehydrogenase family)
VETSQTIGRKSALVTGGAVRLGRALALELARGGFDVAVKNSV